MQLRTCTDMFLTKKAIYYKYIYKKYMKIYIYIYLECYAPLLVDWDSSHVMDVLLASYSCSYQETVEFWVMPATGG